MLRLLKLTKYSRSKRTPRDVHRLHIGCGNNYLENWTNVDNNSDNNITRLDFNWDLSKGIPLPNDSVSFIFNEHFIEHLSHREGIEFLKESYRKLKPKGVIRIACPDLDTLIADYTNDSWREREWVHKFEMTWIPNRCHMLNMCMNTDPWGHKFVYNRGELEASLLQAGFSKENITSCEIGKSQHDALKGLETRSDSMILEAMK